MVDANQVEQLELALHTFQPPTETVRLHAFPAVVRVAPALPLFGEIIWRYTGDMGRATVFIEQEVLRV